MLSVLIAEDNVILADMLEDFLVAGGYAVCGIAGTVAEAVRLADLHRPDLAVFDYRLADGEHGSQIGPLLKSKANVGILYASGDPLHDELTRADGEAYIQKPYGMKNLLQALYIVHEVKLNRAVPEAVFPEGFHLLGVPADHYRQSA
jgi:DNA-binding response OmpR family regulator